LTATSIAPPAAGRHRVGLAALLGAHTVSSIGVAMTFVAMPWFVLETTGSVARTGTVVAVYTVGSAIAGFLAGPAVDRLGFKRVGVLAYLVGGGAMAAIVGLYHAGTLSFAVLLGLVLLATSFDAPGAVALTGLVPGLARAAGTPLERANSAFRGVAGLSQLFGPLLGGLAAVLIGPHNVLLLDAASGAVAAVLVILLVRTPGGQPPARAAGGGRTSYLTELRQGFGMLRRTRLLRALAATGAAHNLLDGALVGIVLIVAAFSWYGDAASFGAMLTAFGAGALVGTIGYGVIGHRVRRRPVFVGATMAVGLPLLVLGLAPPLPVTLAALALAGLAVAPIGPLTTSALQRTVPVEMYGRVVSTVRIIAASTNPLGVSFAAATVTVYGLQPTIAGLAVCYLVIGIGCWWSVTFHDLDGDRPPGSPDRPSPASYRSLGDADRPAGRTS
jgi:MFS family permease